MFLETQEECFRQENVVRVSGADEQHGGESGSVWEQEVC